MGGSSKHRHTIVLAMGNNWLTVVAFQYQILTKSTRTAQKQGLNLTEHTGFLIGNAQHINILYTKMVFA